MFVTFFHCIISVVLVSFVVVVVVTDGSAASAAVIYLPRHRDTSRSGLGHRLLLLCVFVVVPCPCRQTFRWYINEYT